VHFSSLFRGEGRKMGGDCSGSHSFYHFLAAAEKEATAAHADTDLISFKDSPRTWFITQEEIHSK